MRTADARARCIAAVAGALLAGCAGGADAPADLPDPVEYAQQLFEGTNAQRVEAGLEPLEWSECILPVAQERVHVVAVTGELEHAPLMAPCAPGATVGENLSRAAELPGSIVEQWMESAGHEANILNPAFQSVAVACVEPEEDGGPVTCSWVAEGESPESD